MMVPGARRWDYRIARMCYILRLFCVGAPIGPQRLQDPIAYLGEVARSAPSRTEPQGFVDHV